MCVRPLVGETRLPNISLHLNWSDRQLAAHLSRRGWRSRVNSCLERHEGDFRLGLCAPRIFNVPPFGCFMYSESHTSTFGCDETDQHRRGGAILQHLQEMSVPPIRMWIHYRAVVWWSDRAAPLSPPLVVTDPGTWDNTSPPLHMNTGPNVMTARFDY